MTSLSFFDIMKLFPTQRKLVLKSLDEEHWLKVKKKVTPTIDMNATLYRGKMGTTLFLLSLIIFRNNLSNFLLDSRTSGNFMSFSIFKKLGLSLVQNHKKVIQLDKIKVNVVGELKNVHVQIGLDPRI